MLGPDPYGTIPESRETLLEQQKQLLRGKRAVMMFPLGEKGDVVEPLPLPKGFAELRTEFGIFHFDEKAVSVEEIETALKNDKIGQLLGLGPFSKKEVGERIVRGEFPLVIVERTPEGVEVRAAWGTHETCWEQFEVLFNNKDVGNSISIEPVEKVIAERTRM